MEVLEDDVWLKISVAELVQVSALASNVKPKDFVIGGTQVTSRGSRPRQVA